MLREHPAVRDSGLHIPGRHPRRAGRGPTGPTITDGPSGDIADRTPTFSFSSSVAGGRPSPCSDGVQLGASASAVHHAGAVGVGGGTAPRWPPSTARAPADATPAQRDFRILARTVRPPAAGGRPHRQPRAALRQGARGRSRREPAPRAGGRASQKGLDFVPLEEARQIPIGSFLRHRRRAERGSRPRPAAATGPSRASSPRALFQVLQARSGRQRVASPSWCLKGANFSRCRARSSGARAAAAQRRLSRRIVRRLGANANGQVRAPAGRHSAATVRGTVWTTVDRCDGTLTTVKRGRVAVRDFRRRRTVVVRAGKSYLAAPRP